MYFHNSETGKGESQTRRENNRLAMPALVGAVLLLPLEFLVGHLLPPQLLLVLQLLLLVLLLVLLLSLLRLLFYLLHNNDKPKQRQRQRQRQGRGRDSEPVCIRSFVVFWTSVFVCLCIVYYCTAARFSDQFVVVVSPSPAPAHSPTPLIFPDYNKKKHLRK